jgi:hypothetical protein
MTVHTPALRFMLPCAGFLLLLCSSLLPFPRASHARTPRAQGLQGTYTLDDPAANDTVKRAIDAAIKGMGWPKEGIARGRLQKINLPPYRRIVIQFETSLSNLSIITDARAPIVTSPDGTPVDWTREDKEQLKVSTLLPLKTGPLEQTFKSKDGRRVNTYTLNADGKMLTMQVVVTSPQLPRPLTYKLAYKRTP